MLVCVLVVLLELLVSSSIVAAKSSVTFTNETLEYAIVEVLNQAQELQIITGSQKIDLLKVFGKRLGFPTVTQHERNETTHADVQAGLLVLNIVYTAGLIAVIAAMGLLLKESWKRWSSFSIFLLSLCYFILFCFLGTKFRGMEATWVLPQILFTAALAMVPITVYGLHKRAKMPRISIRMRPANTIISKAILNAKAARMVAEFFTVVIGLAMVYFVSFPLLLGVVLISLYFFSIDVATHFFNEKEVSLSILRQISMIFGLFTLFTTMSANSSNIAHSFYDMYINTTISGAEGTNSNLTQQYSTANDFQVWGYVIGMLTFMFGLNLGHQHTESHQTLYLAVQIFFVWLSLQKGRFILLFCAALQLYIQWISYIYRIVRQNNTVEKIDEDDRPVEIKDEKDKRQSKNGIEDQDKPLSQFSLYLRLIFSFMLLSLSLMARSEAEKRYSIFETQESLRREVEMTDNNILDGACSVSDSHDFQADEINWWISIPLLGIHSSHVHNIIFFLGYLGLWVFNVCWARIFVSEKSALEFSYLVHLIANMGILSLSKTFSHDVTMWMWQVKSSELLVMCGTSGLVINTIWSLFMNHYNSVWKTHQPILYDDVQPFGADLQPPREISISSLERLKGPRSPSKKANRAVKDDDNNLLKSKSKEIRPRQRASSSSSVSSVTTSSSSSHSGRRHDLDYYTDTEEDSVYSAPPPSTTISFSLNLSEIDFSKLKSGIYYFYRISLSVCLVFMSIPFKEYALVWVGCSGLAIYLWLILFLNVPDYRHSYGPLLPHFVATLLLILLSSLFSSLLFFLTGCFFLVYCLHFVVAHNLVLGWLSWCVLLCGGIIDSRVLAVIGGAGMALSSYKFARTLFGKKNKMAAPISLSAIGCALLALGWQYQHSQGILRNAVLGFILYVLDSMIPLNSPLTYYIFQDNGDLYNCTLNAWSAANQRSTASNNESPSRDTPPDGLGVENVKHVSRMVVMIGAACPVPVLNLAPLVYIQDDPSHVTFPFQANTFLFHESAAHPFFIPTALLGSVLVHTLLTSSSTSKWFSRLWKFWKRLWRVILSAEFDDESIEELIKQNPKIKLQQLRTFFPQDTEGYGIAIEFQGEKPSDFVPEQITLELGHIDQTQEHNLATIFGVKKKSWLFDSVTKIQLIPQHMPKHCFLPNSSHVTGLLHFGTKFTRGGALISNAQITAILRKLVSSHSDPQFTLVFTFQAKKHQPKRGLLFYCSIKPSQLLNSSSIFDLRKEVEKYSK